MTFTLDAVAEPLHVPPRIALTATESDTNLSVQSVAFFRDGVPLRFEPAVTSDEAIAYDYDAPFDVPLVYRADADEINTAPEFSETWASLASWQSGSSGGPAVGWSVSGGVASSTAADASMYRITATPILQVAVTAPSNITVELLNTAGGLAGYVQVRPDGTVTLSGSSAAQTVTGSGAFTLTVSATSLTVVGTGWAATVPFVGPAYGVLLKAPGAVSYVAKYGTAGTGTGQFTLPRGIAFDSSGNFFVVDETRKRVLKFNSSGVYQSEFGTSGTSAGQFQTPRALAIDASNNVWVTDSGRSKVIKFNNSGTYQAEYGAAGSSNGQFNQPRCIAFDSSGNFFVADSGNNRIQKFNSAGTYQSQFGTTGTGNGQFQGPTGIAIDSANNIYVTEWDGNRVQEFNSAGTYLGQFGSAGAGTGQFNHPGAVAVDSSGNIYVADTYNHRGQKFNSSGTFVAQFGVFGPGDGQFKYPLGIAVRSSGDIYVVDSNNARVQKGTQSGASVDDIVVLGSGLEVQMSATDTETLSPSGDNAGAWLVNAAVPELSILAEAEPLSSDDPYFILTPATRQNRTMAANTATLPIEGSADVMTVVLGPRRSATWSLVIGCTTEAAAEELEALLANTSAINLRFPPTSRWEGLRGGFYAVDDVEGERIGHPQLGPIIVYTLPLTPSRAPKFKPLWEWNWNTLAQTGMSWDDVNTAFTSWNDLLVGPS